LLTSACDLTLLSVLRRAQRSETVSSWDTGAPDTATTGDVISVSGKMDCGRCSVLSAHLSVSFLPSFFFYFFFFFSFPRFLSFLFPRFSWSAPIEKKRKERERSSEKKEEGEKGKAFAKENKTRCTQERKRNQSFNTI
jgi:hypothetical protein